MGGDDMPGDDKVVKIISELRVGISGVEKDMQQAAKHVHTHGQKIIDETERIKRETDAMWKDRSSETGRIAKQEEQMWAQRTREIEKLDNQRLQHGRDVERQLAAETQKRVKEQQAAERTATNAIKKQQQDAINLQRQQNRASGQIPSTDAQVAALQARMRYEGIHDVQMRNATVEMRKQLDILQEQLAATGKLNAEQIEQLNTLRKQAAAMNSQISTMASDQSGTWAGRFKQMLNRRMSWLESGIVLYGGINAISSGLNDISDIEKRMTELSRIIEDPMYKAQDVQKQLFDLANEYGFTFQQVHEIMLRWAQAGYDVADSIAATRSSLLALNTAELDEESSTQAMIGIMTQWGMKATELTKVIDKINKVSDDYSVTSQDIVDALLRSSGAAKNAGMSFEQLVGLITATKTSVGRDGASIGNALNSIFNFFSRDKSQKILESNGIAVFSDTAQTKLRPVFDIIAEMSSKWDGMSTDMQQSLMEDADSLGLLTEQMAEASGSLSDWTDLQKRDLLTAGAQSYRRNYLIGLLKNFSQVYDVLKTQEEAIGYSQRENARTMENYSKKIEQLKAAMQELIVSIGEEGGVLSGLKKLVDGVHDGIEWFNGLSSSTKELIFYLLKMAAVYASINALSKGVTGISLLGGLTNLANGKSWSPIISGIRGITAALGGLGAAALTIAPLVAALAILAGAAVYVNNRAMRLQNTFAETKESMDALVQASEAQVKQHTETAKSVMQLADEYRLLQQQQADYYVVNGVASDELASKQQMLSVKIREALGRETADRLSAANFSKQAVDEIVKNERAKADAAKENADKQIREYKRTLAAQAQEALNSIDILEQKKDGWTSYLNFMESITAAQVAMQAIGLKAIENMYNTVFDNLKAVYKNFAADFQQFATLFEKVHAPDWMQDSAKGVTEFFNRAAEGTSKLDAASEKLTQKWREDLKKEAEGVQNTALTRQRKLIADIQAQIDSLGGAGGGGGNGTDPGVLGAGAGNMKATATSIIDNVEALQAEAEATNSLITLLKTRIDYETREGASIDELNAADRDRAQLLELITKRQGDLANIAEVSRNAIDAMRSAQAGLNRTTEEGNSAWEDLENKINSLIKLSGTHTNPVGDLSEQWWSLQKEAVTLMDANNAVSTQTIRNLKDMKDSYDKGLTPLDDYVSSLQKMQVQAGLTKDAMTQLNEELGAGLLKQWTNELNNELDKGDKALKQFGDDLSNVFDDVEKAGKKNDTSVMMNALRGNLSSLTGKYSLPTNTYDAATATTKGLIGDILNNKFAPNADALLKVDRTQFLTAVQQGKDDLMSAANSVNDLLISIANERDSVVRNLENQIKPISDVLAQFDKLDKVDAAKELRSALDVSYGKLMGKENAIPGLPTKDDVKALFGSITAKDWGALSPDKFADMLKQNMTTLRGYSTTAKSYLESVTKNYSQQINDIDDKIKKIDTDLKAALKPLQDQLDAMDKEDKQASRDKEKADLDAKKKAIDDELAWRLQNEDKYAFEIAALRKQQLDIDKQISDKKTEWDKEDKKESIQKQMKDLQEQSDAKKTALEAEKQQLQEQKAMWEEALGDVLKYIDGELNGLKEIAQERVSNLNDLKQQKTDQYNTLLEALGNVQKYVQDELKEWQSLADGRKAIEEAAWGDTKDSIKSVIEKGTLGVLSLMTANGRLAGEGYVQSLIDGINSQRANLQNALNSLTNATTQPTSYVPMPSAYRYNTKPVAFANEGYVTARRGGIWANIGEAGVDEAVLRVDRLQPKIDKAVFAAMNSFATMKGSIGATATDIAYAVKAGLSSLKFYGAIDVTLPSGEVKRQVIEVFAQSGLGQAVRAM